MSSRTPHPPQVLELAIPDSFRASYNNFTSYPTNLVLKTSYPAALNVYRTRLNNSASQLFVNDRIYLVFREFTGVGADGGLDKVVITDEASLHIWLGAQSSSRPSGGFATKRDPKCRYIFITADSSQKPLRITQSMVAGLCTYHQVMPAYLDFLMVFGSHAGARELRFGGFREQISLSNPPLGPVIEALGRSGRQYQLCYNLKTVACKSKPNTSLLIQEWSIRQAAIHHQFDVEYGTTLWIVTQGKTALKDRISDMTSVRGRPEDRAFTTREECFRTSLTTHLLHCQWSTEEWRWYIQWMEQVFDKETDVAVYGTRNIYGEYIYTPKHVQMVQHLEDKVNIAIMVMEANAEILLSLRDFYRRLGDNQNFDIRNECQDDILNFTSQVNDLVYDSRMQIARAQVLAKLTADRKNLTLQHLQTQDAGKMEELTRLTIKIATMSQREAIAMRIVTVVTLIYLPATFVSTFFSTDVVKYQAPPGDDLNDTNTIPGPYNGSFSQVALERWLQITIPLTCLTLLAGWTAFRKLCHSADKEFEYAQLPQYETNIKQTVHN